MNSRRSLTHGARLALVALSLLPLGLFAQGTEPAGPPPNADAQDAPHHGRGGDPAQRQAHMLEAMTRKLDLTPDQVSQIKGVQTDSVAQMQALRSDNSVQGPDRRAKAMAIHKAEQDKIRALLNDDQKTKFDAMAARHHEHHGEGKGEQPAPPSA